jgi:cytochrome c553
MTRRGGHSCPPLSTGGRNICFSQKTAINQILEEKNKMNIMEFAGKFAAALVASVIAMFVISFVVDAAYGPVGAPMVVQTEQAAPTKTTATTPEPPAAKAPEAAKSTKPAKPAEVKVAATAKPARKKRHPGRKIYLRKGACAACHGRKGQRSISYYPSIAGQDKKYIALQINDIMKGKRKGGVDKDTGHPSTEAMRGALVAPDGSFRVTDEDVKVMADWLHGLPPAKPRAPETPIPAENIATGKKLFKKCVACHGKEGKKPLKGYPFVAGQKRQYLIMQLTDIRDKIRTNGKTKLMIPFVKKLSDDQIAMIADYLSQVDRTK